MIALLKLMPYTGATMIPSPNRDARNAPAIQGIVLHATEDGGNEVGTLSWLRSPKSRVSAHLFVSRGGDVTRLVGDQQRAWHAGISWWRGTSDVNSITLGIEIANRNDGEPFTNAQYGRVAEIVAHYCRQGLALEDVVSHAEIAGGRRTDPYGWDWDRFRAMVREQLRAADDPDARRWLSYDRRSVERLVADEVAALPAPSITPSDPARPTIPVISVVEPRVITPPAAQSVPSATPSPRTSGRASRPNIPPIIVPKPVLRSRTIWLNAITMLAAFSVIMSQTLDLAFSVGLTPPERFTAWVLFIVGFVNIILRFQTTCPIGNCDVVYRLPREGATPVPSRVPARPQPATRGARP